MVRVTFLGGLGNNLFQYAFARIIADHLKLALACESGDSQASVASGHESRATLSALSHCFPNAPLRRDGDVAAHPVEKFEVNSCGWRGQTVSVKELLANTARRHIRLSGFFQRFEYYAPHTDRLREWFDCGASNAAVAIGDGDVLVSIRRGYDYGRLGWVLPLSYYDLIIEGLSCVERLVVCGVGIDDQVRRHFGKRNAVFVTDESPMSHFRLIQRCRRIVLSNSTFAWWASYLSAADEIYAPRAVTGSGYAFTGFGEVDLHMRESRYREVPVHSFWALERLLVSRIRGAEVTHRRSYLTVTRPGAGTIEIGKELTPIIELLATRDSVSESELNEALPIGSVKSSMSAAVHYGLATARDVCRDAATGRPVLGVA